MANRPPTAAGRRTAGPSDPSEPGPAQALGGTGSPEAAGHPPAATAVPDDRQDVPDRPAGDAGDPTGSDDPAGGRRPERRGWAEPLRREAPALGAVLAAWGLTRLLAVWAGVRFDAGMLEYGSQIMDPELLTHEMTETIWYLHAQPPLFNLGIALVLRSGLPVVGTLHAVYLAFGLALAVGCYVLARLLGLGRTGAAVLAVVVVASPPAILYESWLSYEYPAAALVVWACVAVGAWVRSGSAWALAAVGLLGATTVLTRSMFHPLWLVGLLGVALLARRPERWRPALVAAVVPVLLVGGVVVRNQVLFGTTELSTWFGFNLHRVLVDPLPEDVRQGLRDDGTLTAPPAVEPCEVSRPDVAVLAEPLKRGPRGEAGYPNHNWECAIAWHDALGEDAVAALRAEPRQAARAWASGAGLAGSPSTLYFALVENRAHIEGADTAYRRVVLGDVAWDPVVESPAGWTTRLSAPDERFHLSLTLVAASLAAVAGAAVVALRWAMPGARRRVPDARAAVLLVGGATVGFVLAVSILFEHGENQRIRYPAEPLTLVLAGALLGAAWHRWVGPRLAARRAAPSLGGDGATAGREEAATSTT